MDSAESLTRKLLHSKSEIGEVHSLSLRRPLPGVGILRYSIAFLFSPANAAAAASSAIFITEKWPGPALCSSYVKEDEEDLSGKRVRGVSLRARAVFPLCKK